MAKSPLSYPGGKFKALPKIIPLIPDNAKNWYECFFGGGSVSIGYIQSTKCSAETFTVCEISPEIWGFWEGTKLYAPEAQAIAKRWFTEKAPTQIAYYTTGNEELLEQAIAEGRELWKWTQEVDCSQLSLAERAARTFIVNKISFSGMGDSGSISIDQFKNFRLDMTDKLLEIQPILKKIDIRNVSFEELFYEANKNPDDNFMFLDPPYITQGETSPMYGRKGDTHKGFDHQFLARLCREAKFKWLMTYDDSPRVRRLYNGLYLKEFQIPYTMAGKTAEDALAGEELFIANYDICEEDSFDTLGSVI